jgi:hypothetical protein
MPLWARLTVVVAGLKVAFGMALYLSGLMRSGPTLVPVWVYAALAAAFTLLGCLLVIGNRRDPRAAWLGGMFILIAAPLTPLVNAFVYPAPGFVTYLRPEALQPVFVWRFLAEFPSPLTGQSARAIRWLSRAMLIVGLWCAAANLSIALTPLTTSDAWRRPFLVSSGAYWLLIFGLTLPALPALLWRARGAGPKERPHVQLFVRALLLGLAPFTIEVIVEELIPAYKAFTAAPAVRPIIALLLFGSLATVPFATAYSVLFDRVVEVRVVVRTALQYALARYTILALTLIPFVALAMFLYSHRTEALVSLMAGPRPLLLSGAAGVGLVTLRLRHRWLEGVDRRYFREPYDAQQIVTRFVGDLHGESPEVLAQRVQLEVERALHADAEVFFANEARSSLRHAGGRLAPLAANATLVELALNDPRPMEVDLDRPASALQRLPETEKRWLAQGPFRLVVALRSGAGAIAGLLVLSAKRSGLEYSNVDRHLLSAVAATCGLVLDNLRLRSTPTPSEPPAKECLECSRLNPSDAPNCACGGAVTTAAAPYLLRGIFRLEHRIGAGGMGIVYRAADLNLGRDVAIKTLPRVSPDQAARLRKEARAMAVVTHPNLAVVHGIETWQGTPFLVTEYLAGGTLAQRLVSFRPSLNEALQLGVTLAEVLEQLHLAGILHCDVKPSNIGFTQRGVVKLLDFGLARLLRESRADTDEPTTMGGTKVDRPAAASASGAFAGTPHYMSPEAVRGDRPTPAFDIWALSVVLYEIIAGRRPFEGESSHQVFERIVGSQRPDLSLVVPDCPQPVVAVFARLLALDLSVRPRDAGTLRRDLQALRL